MRPLALLILPAALLAQPAPPPVLLVPPYLQLGADRAKGLALMWHAPDLDAEWSVELQDRGRWKALPAPAFRRYDAPEPHRIYEAPLAVAAGTEAPYRLKRNGAVVFEGTAHGRPAPGAPQRFVLTGDGGWGSPEEKAVTYRISLQKPDYVVIAGDLVYGRGLASEYRARFFPVYNAGTAAPDAGAPLMRTVPFVGAVGNHDVPLHETSRFPDGLAYFPYWSQPLDGPDAPTPALDPALKARLEAAAGPRYPRMGSFSFEAGDAHWTVLDSNPYVDWSDPRLQAWVDADLRQAKGARWRFVAFHHPPFQSSPSHAEDQWMRTLVPLFEKHKVDVVFAGHVHNYQRTAPLRFRPAPGAAASWKEHKGRIDGAFQVDAAFDGVRHTRPKGILYVVSGAGGAPLYEDRVPTAQPFTRAYRVDGFSFTLVDLSARKLHLRQMDPEGKVIDEVTVTK